MGPEMNSRMLKIHYFYPLLTLALLSFYDSKYTISSQGG
jgi:hypothetical protein